MCKSEIFLLYKCYTNLKYGMQFIFTFILYCNKKMYKNCQSLFPVIRGKVFSAGHIALSVVHRLTVVLLYVLHRCHFTQICVRLVTRVVLITTLTLLLILFWTVFLRLILLVFLKQDHNITIRKTIVCRASKTNIFW